MSEVSRDDVLAVFAGLEDPHAPLTAGELASHLDCPPEQVPEVARRSVERGELRTKAVGADGRVYWQPGSTVARDWEGETRLELTYRSDRLAAPFRGTVPAGTTISVDGVVELDDGSHLQYWTVEGAPPNAVMASVREFPTVLDARLMSTVEDTCRIEVLGARQSMVSSFAGFDGRTTEAAYDETGVAVVAEFPRPVDVGAVTDAVREVYPDLELAARRVVYTTGTLRGTVEDRLTDRQSTALRAAYHAGYFARPRESTGDEVAERMGITKQAFHEHLRKAERAVFEALFDRTAGAGG